MLTAFIPRLGVHLSSCQRVAASWGIVLVRKTSTVPASPPPSSDNARGGASMRTRLVKASAFTGQTDFYESLFFLQDVLKKVQSISKPSSLPSGIATVWYAHEAMSNSLGFALTGPQYRKFRAMLMELAAYLHVPEIRKFLDVFSSKSLLRGDEHPGSHATGTEGGSGKLSFAPQGPNLGRIDSLGRAVSIGRRKTASAKVYLVPGTGECFVNGIPAIEYFKRPQEMFAIADPFVRAAAFGKYNAWCLTKGGGLSGQAGAICHGLAKAIVLLDPKTRGRLASLLVRDPRMVERKKSGQPKARKKFTWVKR